MGEILQGALIVFAVALAIRLMTEKGKGSAK